MQRIIDSLSFLTNIGLLFSAVEQGDDIAEIVENQRATPEATSIVEISLESDVELALDDSAEATTEVPRRKVFKCAICSEEFTTKNAKLIHYRQHCEPAVFAKHPGDEESKHFSPLTYKITILIPKHPIHEHRNRIQVH